MSTEHSPHRAAIWRSIGRSASVVAVLLCTLMLVPLRGDRWWVGALVGIALLVTIVPLAIVHLRRVLSSDRPIFEAFEALAMLIAMLIVGFAAVYYGMNRDGTQLIGLETRVDSLYFTVTTLSTVGFGDITARSQTARGLVTVQILFDLVFIGVAVRVFVGAARRRAGARSSEGEPPPGPVG